MFEIPIRIYIEDTDAGGIVFYGNYLKFFERARTDFLRSIGFEQSVTIDERLIFVVKSVRVEYAMPVRLDDTVMVSAILRRVAPARINFEQLVRRAEDDIIVCSGEIEVVSVNMDTLKPVAMSKSLQVILKNELENQ